LRGTFVLKFTKGTWSWTIMPNETKAGSVRNRLAAGECLFGPFLNIAACVTAETAGYAGFDFCVIDVEHSPFTFERAEELVRAAQVAGIASIVRTYDAQPSTSTRALDTGCDGILVPNLSSRSEAEAVVQGARFYPQGERGVHPYARSARYGAIPAERYFVESRERTLVAVQLEGLEGLENLGDIVATEGIDVVFVGPYDLSQSLGVPGQVNSPLVLARIDEIVTEVRASHKATGIYADNVEDARRWRDKGIQFVGVGFDVRILLRAYQAMVDALRK
jgi:4-hydroxy-2-oxoheptanedioate aldolase